MLNPLNLIQITTQFGSFIGKIAHQDDHRIKLTEICLIKINPANPLEQKLIRLEHSPVFCGNMMIIEVAPADAMFKKYTKARSNIEIIN